MTTITVPRAVLEQALEALEAMKAEFRALDLPYGSKAYAAGNQAAHGLRAALTQQEQEPVAIVEGVVPHLEVIIIKHILGARFPKIGDFLYTSPPRREWQLLSEEEIDDLSRTMVKGHKSVNWLTRAIEAKLKEKNNG